MTQENNSYGTLVLMIDIVIVHRKSNREFCFPESSPQAVWKTCLRQIAFVDSHDLADFAALNDIRGDDVFCGEEGIQFLIEVCCGLHSPVFGETEIFGQFKTYYEGLDSSHILRRTSGLGRQIYRAVKEVRHCHLREAGTLSYGQMLRRKLRSESRVVIWGMGQFGRELSRWLDDKDVTVVVRNPEKLQSQNLPELKTLPRLSVIAQANWKDVSESAVHIIAAPIDDSLIERLVESADVKSVYDLRDGKADESGCADVVESTKLYSLREMMREVESLKSEQRKVLPVCRQSIARRVQEFLALAFHRPYGWEDLCG